MDCRVKPGNDGKWVSQVLLAMTVLRFAAETDGSGM
jgi:hypothetical protein